MISAVIDRYKLHIRICKLSLRSCSEIGHSASDRNNYIRIFCKNIGCISTCNTDSSHAVWMTWFTCTFSSLCLTKWNLEFFTEFFYFFPSFRVTNTSTNNNKWFLRICDHICNIFNLFFHCHWSCNSVNSFLKEIFREIKGFTFHILAKTDAACSCFCWIC